MQRRDSSPRPDWQRITEAQGLTFHTPDGVPYWNESAYYQFTLTEIEMLESATLELDALCLDAVEHLLTERADWLEHRFLIPPPIIELCRRSWARDEWTIYGRFDLAYDGRSPPKLLEYNADTPTSLIESAVVQWHWMKDVVPAADQFNSLHERLIEAWGRWRSESPFGGASVAFLGVQTSDEDAATVTYLRDTAQQAGVQTRQFDVSRLAFHRPRGLFTDPNGQPVHACFKLYPWEWMVREPFAQHLLPTFDRLQWLEPPWKMILANKAILPVLWAMHPNHPNLLPAAFERLPGACVRKPIFGREGRAVRFLSSQHPEPAYEPTDPFDGPPIYQALAPIPSFGQNHPVIGSWMVNGHACGLGIREDDSKITGNLSRFVPHVLIG